MINLGVKITLGIFVLVTTIQILSISQLSDDYLLVRAVSPTVDATDRLTPSWMAKAKLKIFGLKSCDIPKRNSSIPVVSYLVAGYGDKDLDEETSDELIIWAIEQGCSVDSREDTGLLPIHAAIIFDQPRVLSFLLTLGADLNLKVVRAGSIIDGMSTKEFANFIVKKHPTVNSAKIIDILNEIEKT